MAERQGFEPDISRNLKHLANAGGNLKSRLQPIAALNGL